MVRDDGSRFGFGLVTIGGNYKKAISFGGESEDIADVLMSGMKALRNGSWLLTLQKKGEVFLVSLLSLLK